MSRNRIEIVAIESGHIPKILSIANTELGKGYLKKEYLLHPDTLVHVAVNEHDEVVGFSCGKVVKTEELKRFTNKKFPPHILNQLPKKKNIGVTLSLAVERSVQRTGIGTMLFESRNRAFFNSGAACILMTGWQKPDGTTAIKPLAEKYRFVPIGIIPKFFYRESLERNYTCPVCGPPPCLCNAVVYWRESTTI